MYFVNKWGRFLCFKNYSRESLRVAACIMGNKLVPNIFVVIENIFCSRWKTS